MSPFIHVCVLCGYVIGDHDGQDTDWTVLYRILYCIGEGVTVTGVGFIDETSDGYLDAPLDFNARWDTSESRVEIGLICQRPIDGRYGFPFHEACWSLLEEAYSPSPIPQRRLFEVCRSLPFSHRLSCITWGHDFGGVIAADDNSYPWEDLFVDKNLAFARHNPYLVPEIQQLPYETPQSPNIFKSISKSADVFAKLPFEIIISISLCLSTVDYLSSRLALPSFYPVFYTQKFWASRFLPNADRSWVFESRNWDMACDWLWLYRRTSSASHRMKNRERVWRLIEKVKPILDLQWIEPAPCFITDVANTNWLQAAGDIRPETQQPYHDFGGGCRQFCEKQVHIPPAQLSRLAFSLIQLGNATYITGLRFVLTQGVAIRLGYIADEERILDITHLTGFNLAVGSRGIQAIQCIVDNERKSPWIGCPHDAPRTKRLMFTGPITGMKAGFDGFKLVSLAANGCGRPDQGNLRNSAFWYPRIPETGIHLNEKIFTAKEASMNRYDPICWTLFGGPSGIYLRSLIGMSVTTDGCCVRAIEFHYNSEDIPLECRKLGRCTPSDYATTLHFKIDGPGGEVIDFLAVDTCID
ncbi:hypothetical protein ED733_007548 [Metarhizium rileyi]|uniref:DUF7600 domain-containing protein n=1 Tax=Metarhizium rileyi (strain RCEF 4871) TaxID=1649241 RepID=A0A5C6GLQ1_METRR|nr:hypothetical protein ED733_007548 [Metarhizium rileyi]